MLRLSCGRGESTDPQLRKHKLCFQQHLCLLMILYKAPCLSFPLCKTGSSHPSGELSDRQGGEARPEPSSALPGKGEGKDICRVAGTAQRTLEPGFSTAFILKNEESWMKGKKFKKSGEKPGGW